MQESDILNGHYFNTMPQISNCKKKVDLKLIKALSDVVSRRGTNNTTATRKKMIVPAPPVALAML